MERFKISLAHDKKVLEFEVADYLHHQDDHCKFEVFQNNEFIASFEPDRHKYLRICKSSGKIDEEILNLIADKLERLQP